jgi:hypothetical protein
VLVLNLAHHLAAVVVAVERPLLERMERMDPLEQEVSVEQEFYFH